MLPARPWGIGRAIALELGQEGRCVCVNYLHHAEAAQEVVRQLQARGCRAMAVQADVADRAAVEQMIHTVEDAWGPVDLLVNNAGISLQGCSRTRRTNSGTVSWASILPAPAIPFRPSCLP